MALLPPADVLAHLDAFLDVRREDPGLRWAQPDQVHVTTAFLAEVPDRALEDLAQRLAQAAARRTSFAARIAGGGAFPDVGSARVLWAGLELDPAAGTELERLAAGCRTAAARSGIRVDGARFRPHLTLARTRHPQELTRWVRLLDGYAGPLWRVDRVSLVHSHLGEGPRGRPRYEVVAEAALTPE